MKITQKSCLVLGVLAAMVSYSTSCSSKKVSPPRIASSSPDGGTGTPGTGDGTPGGNPDETDPLKNPKNKVEALSSSFGLLNFRQMTSTYASLTGVNLSTPAVAAEYTKQLGSLPREYGPAQISAAKVSAATKLAAQYCDVLATSPALATKFPGLSLAAAPADSTAFAKTLIDGFYGPESALQGVRATDVATVAATVEALKGLNGTGPAIFMASCAAILASAEFYLY